MTLEERADQIADEAAKRPYHVLSLGCVKCGKQPSPDYASLCGECLQEMRRQEEGEPLAVQNMRDRVGRHADAMAQRILCEHPSAYYSAESDNFYCCACQQGMGVPYYERNIGAVLEKYANDVQPTAIIE